MFCRLLTKWQWPSVRDQPFSTEWLPFSVLKPLCYYKDQLSRSPLLFISIWMMSVYCSCMTGWFFRWKFISSHMIADVSVQMCGVTHNTSDHCLINDEPHADWREFPEIRGGINTVISLKYILNNDVVVGNVFERLHISGKDTMKYYYTLK